MDRYFNVRPALGRPRAKSDFTQHARQAEHRGRRNLVSRRASTKFRLSACGADLGRILSKAWCFFPDWTSRNRL